MSNNWLPARTQEQIDLRMYAQREGHTRAVVGWTAAGSSYRSGRKVPGWVHLDLSGGGYLYYSEETSIADALADARARGYATADAEAKLAHWVKTGEGVRFTLK